MVAVLVASPSHGSNVGVHMGFWQRFVLKEGGGGGGRRGHQSHLRDAPSCSSHPSSAAVGSVTAQKSLLEVPCRDSSVHLTAQLPSDKSETNCERPPWAPHLIPRDTLSPGNSCGSFTVCSERLVEGHPHGGPGCDQCHKLVLNVLIPNFQHSREPAAGGDVRELPSMYGANPSPSA